MEEVKKEKKTYIIFLILFFVFSILHVVFLLQGGLLNAGIYNFYILLYIVSKIFIVFSVISCLLNDKKAFINQCILSIIVDLSILIIYILYMKKVVFVACILSIIEFFFLLEIKRHMAYNNPEKHMLSNIFYSLGAVIIAVCFLIVFIVFVFTNVPVFKEITAGVTATIDSIQKFGKTIDDAKNTIDDFSKNINGFSDNIGNISNSIGSGLENLFKH